MNGLPPMPGLWQEARNSDGRTYYYNTQTKATQWTKPEALMTPAERALSNQPWKEYTAEGGRKYWYNTETKTSSWEMPEVYKDALSQGSSIPAKPPPSQTYVAGGGSGTPQYSQQNERDDFRHPDRGGPERPREHDQRDNFRSNFVPATTNDPDYHTFEEAEAAFMKLLKRSNVEPDWTWEQTMKAIIKDPQYRSLKDPKDRKAAFQKYVVEAEIQDRERVKERLAKLRADFATMLRSHPEIKHYTRWKTARPIIEGETIFRSTNSDTERRQLFEEYIIELKKAHAEREANQRKAALDDLVSILKGLNLEPYTRWSEAQGIINSNEKFQNDEKFKALSKSDVLLVFDNHIKSLERTFNDARQLEKNQKTRRERQRRDEYISLLRDLRSSGKIKAGTKWMNIHGLIEDDPRYVALLGQPGSTPLDLFWDVVEEEERALRGKRSDVLDVLDDRDFKVTPKSTLEEFMSIVQADRRTASISKDDLTLIFTRQQERILRSNEDDKHQQERQQRRAVDALRSRIKHLDPPVRISDSWEDVSKRVERYEEYKALESDEMRRQAFDKVIRRLKDKEADLEQDRSRRSDPRDRDSRNGHRSSKHGRYSRTPEVDAYEADRRKAQTDRKRSYRKSSGTGLSPAPSDRRRERERDPRDRYDDRHSSRLPRKGRDDRERLRSDGRDSGAELDYGESGRAGSMSGSASRKRRDSEDSESYRKDSKRARRDRRSRTPLESAAPSKAAEKDAAYKSGSEEGEIEEE